MSSFASNVAVPNTLGSMRELTAYINFSEDIMNESTDTTPDTVGSTPAVASSTPPKLPNGGLLSQQKPVARPGQPRRAMTSSD